MLDPNSNIVELPPIPGKRYFTIGEVSDCASGQAARACGIGSRSSRSSSRSSGAATAAITSVTTWR